MIRQIVENIKKQTPYYNLDKKVQSGIFKKIKIKENGDDYEFEIETRDLCYITTKKIKGIINDPKTFQIIHSFFQQHNITELIIFIKRRRGRELYYVKAQRKEVKIIA